MGLIPECSKKASQQDSSTRICSSRCAIARVVGDRGALDREEVFLGAPGRAAVGECLEVLLGPARHASFLERVADQGAAAAGRGADEVGTLGFHRASLPLYPQ